MKTKSCSLIFSLALSAILSAISAKAVIYRPGLTQVRYTCTSSTQADINLDFSTIQEDLRDRTAGCIMGNKSWGNGGVGNLSDSSESFTGKQWYWDNNFAYGYEGEIWLDAETVITVGGCFDDGYACVIDGTEVFNQGNLSGYSNKRPAGQYTSTFSGWHSLRAFVWDWTAGKNICNSALAALQWNTNNVTTINANEP